MASNKMYHELALINTTERLDKEIELRVFLPFIVKDIRQLHADSCPLNARVNRIHHHKF